MPAQTRFAPVTDAANWLGADIGDKDGWRFELGPGHIDALATMAASIRPHLDGDPNRLLALPRDAFDPGAAEQVISGMYQGLKSGPGIALIKGLPIDKLDPIDVATIYWAVGLHLGTATPNNPEGDMFGHITDLGKTQADPNSRGYQTREAMDYHCDQADIVGLICIRAAKSGGESRVASSVAMYNTLLRRHPDYVQALSQPLYWTKHGEYGEGELPYYTSPVFNFFDATLCTSFGPKHIVKGHALPGAPEMTDLQREALATAEQIAHEQRFDMVLEPGDMQFLNNYVALHTRSAFEDHPEPERKRLLWRLWLMNPDLRQRTAYSKQWQSGVGLGSGHTQIRV